jgi:hypothetical protein
MVPTFNSFFQSANRQRVADACKLVQAFHAPPAEMTSAIQIAFELLASTLMHHYRHSGNSCFLLRVDCIDMLMVEHIFFTVKTYIQDFIFTKMIQHSYNTFWWIGCQSIKVGIFLFFVAVLDLVVEFRAPLNTFLIGAGNTVIFFGEHQQHRVILWFES